MKNNVYIFSNISTKYVIKNIKENDILIFLNTAKEYPKYKNLKCRKILFHRWLCSQKKYAGNIIKQIQNQYIRGKKQTRTEEQIQLDNNYDYNYDCKKDTTKQPTTGYIIYLLCKKRFPDYHIFLVNFFPNSDFSTLHSPCHNWKYEQEFYKKSNVDIIDTREKNLMKEQYQKLYEIKPEYGSDQHKYFQLIKNIIKQNNFTSILDYGCGNATLYKKFQQNKIEIEFYNYDFAIPKYNKFPNLNKKIDLVVCFDVLEHVPEMELYLILDKIFNISDNVIFNISLRKAINKLPNNENCHCTVHDKKWWINYLNYFVSDIKQIANYEKDSLFCIVKK